MEHIGIWLGPLLGALGGGLASYVAIRSDLAALRARVDNLENGVTRSHLRIDQILHGG
jgi:hypothetical protein